MGLFDFLMSDEKKIKKNHRTLVNRDAQPEDREIAARWLADNGTGAALLALLNRFDVKLDNQLKDAAEKEFVYALAGSRGKDTVGPLETWLLQCRQIAWPLRLYQELTSREEAIGVVYKMLAIEYERDDFKPHKKKQLLIWLADVKHEGALEVVVPFLDDFDEGVRYAAAEASLTQNDPESREKLLALLANPEEESIRLKVRIAEAFAKRRWSVTDGGDLAELLPNGYAVRDGRIVQVS